MFLKKLYIHNKVLFFSVTAFLVAYLYLNYKWGIIATPVQQYGMFSGRHNLQDSLPVFTIRANGKIINNAGLSPIERDLLQSFPVYYMEQQKTNDATFYALKKYLFFKSIFSESRHQYKFYNEINDSVFTEWYTTKVGGIIHEKLTSIEVYQQIFTWKNNQLIPIDTPAKMNFIVAR